MYSFRNDYSETAHPSILKALVETNMEQDLGYGLDRHCENAAAVIKKLIGSENADIHFLVGGTQTNLTAISSFLRPHEAVIAADTAHISTHETGAIEATGHKVIEVKGTNGKISVSQIKAQLEYHSDEHMVKPRVVKISNATELGTVYTRKELAEISCFCKENNLLLYVDGARLGAALAALKGDLSLKDMYELTDAFYIGGTKNGALAGEALIIKNDALKCDFRYLMKQKGAMLAKGRVLGIQFEELFRDDLFFKLAEHANEMAGLISSAFKSAGFDLLAETETNQVFPILPNNAVKSLEANIAFQFWQKIDENKTAVRFVASWATTEDGVNALREEIAKLA